MRKRLVVLTGAGISAESGLRTFRGNDGMWEHENIEDVCTPDALRRDPKRVKDFYNFLRKGLPEHQPNAAHIALAKLEEKLLLYRTISGSGIWTLNKPGRKLLPVTTDLH